MSRLPSMSRMKLPITNSLRSDVLEVVLYSKRFSFYKCRHRVLVFFLSLWRVIDFKHFRLIQIPQ